MPPHIFDVLNWDSSEGSELMKAIMRENRDMQYVKNWSKNKMVDVYKLLEEETIEPATPAYIAVKQISDAATHFVAEYRTTNDLKT